MNISTKSKYVVGFPPCGILLLRPPDSPWKDDFMQMRQKCSCRRKGCTPANAKMFKACPSKKIWFCSFRWKGKWHGRSLGEDEGAAHGQLFEFCKYLKGGGSLNILKPFKDVIFDYLEWAVNEDEKSESSIKDIESRLGKNVLPAFGSLIIGDISKGVIKEYKKNREKAGATKSTIQKEIRIVNEVCTLFNPAFQPVKFTKKTKWINKGKKVNRSLTVEEVGLVGEKVLASSDEHGEVYQRIYFFMAFTGLDIGDVVWLNQNQIVDGFVMRNRGKTDEELAAFLVPKALDLLTVVGIDGYYFSVPSQKAVSTAILRAFSAAGVAGNSKALRHFAATQLELAGLKKKLIQTFLGHAAGSRITDDYLHGDKELVMKAFKGLSDSPLLKRVGELC